MSFTDHFIQRPVLAIVVSSLLLLLGGAAMSRVNVREFPELERSVIYVETIYPGASARTVQGFVTTPLQVSIAGARGIEYMTSISNPGSSEIEVHVRLGESSRDVLSEVIAKVNEARGDLPSDVEEPVITTATGGDAMMYLAFYSKEMNPYQITDYLLRTVQPELATLEGVGKVKIFGRFLAMRIWLDPVRMAALGVTAAEVSQVLEANNYLSGVGGTKGDFVKIDLRATTDAISEDEFKALVVGNRGGTLVRLQDIAKIELGSEDYDAVNWYKGKMAIFMGIEQAPGANPLTVAKAVKVLLNDIERDLPDAMHVLLPYDASEFIEDSINEVFSTLIEAVVIVLIVIFLTLGSFRAALVPAVTVPLSLIGGAFLMLLLGFSVNLLTMLALVLAIGLVVDDAIVMVENIHRHIEDGQSRMQAALLGARELGLPVIAMTTTLVAVYAPIGFMGGLVGTLFTEFAFTLAGAVLVSGVVALTLSPMMSSRVLKEAGQPGRFELAVEHFFTGLAAYYQRMLHKVIEYPVAIALFAVLVLVSIYFMFMLSNKELAPTEDQSILFAIATAPQTATLQYNEAYSRELIKQFESIPEHKESFLIMGFGGDTSSVLSGFKLPSTFERERSQSDIQPELQAKVGKIAGFQTAVVPRPSLPGSGGGLPLQFVMVTDADYRVLDQVADQLLAKAMQSGKFAFMSKEVSFDRPQTTLVINRDRAADLGIDMQEIGRNLATLLGGQYVNRFSLQGRSYKVIPQVDDLSRMDVGKLDNYYLRTASGGQVPLSSLVALKDSVEPSKRTQFQQLNSLTLNGLMIPGVGLGDAMAYLEQVAEEIFPRGFSYDYTGASRQYAQQGSALILTFFMALLVIYLVLAAQFESWRDPLIILISVPLSIASALAFIMLGFASVNIYTQVGLITLIGLIAKNGILIVEFANQLQSQQKLDKFKAVEQAATIRLRPILMTTVSMIVAMIPLLMATGPGAAARFDIGLVIATGLGIGTLFTLFVVPAFYLLLAREHQTL